MKRALLLLVAAMALLVVPLGAAETAYTDPAGDSGSGPDITTVTVSNDEAGVVTVRIAISLEPSSAVAMVIDADRNSSTGDEFGLEGFVGVVNVGGLVMAEALDEEGDELPGVVVPASFADGVLAFSFPREAFSIDQAFAFGFITMQIDSIFGATVGDIAPADPCLVRDVRCRQLWVYELIGVAPAPPPPPPAVKPMIGKPKATPAAPMAGKKFTVRFPVTSSVDKKPLKTGTAECKTTVAGKTVRHTHTFKGGVLKATVKIPKAAKGKKLRIAVQVTADKTTRKVFTFKVKK